MVIGNAPGNQRGLYFKRVPTTPQIPREHPEMNKKQANEEDEPFTESSTSSVARAARLRREAKTGSLRSLNKRRAISHSRRKNAVVGGMHLRGNKRTLR